MERKSPGTREAPSAKPRTGPVEGAEGGTRSGRALARHGPAEAEGRATTRFPALRSAAGADETRRDGAVEARATGAREERGLTEVCVRARGRRRRGLRLAHRVQERGGDEADLVHLFADKLGQPTRPFTPLALAPAAPTNGTSEPEEKGADPSLPLGTPTTHQ